MKFIKFKDIVVMAHMDDVLEIVDDSFRISVALLTVNQDRWQFGTKPRILNEYSCWM